MSWEIKFSQEVMLPPWELVLSKLASKTERKTFGHTENTYEDAVRWCENEKAKDSSFNVISITENIDRDIPVHHQKSFSGEGRLAYGCKKKH